MKIKESFEYLQQKLCQLILLVLMTQSLTSHSLPPTSSLRMSGPHKNRERRQDSTRDQLVINQECPINFIDCDNGRCVKFELIRNGIDDCGNGKDELYPDCPANQFKCHNSTKCLKFDFICDGHPLTDNCPERSDEKSCFCPRVLCKGHCVPKGWSGCEGYPECLRKEDELLCLKDGKGGIKMLVSSQETLSDSPPISGSNTKVNLSIEEVINNSLSLISLSTTTQDNFLQSSVDSSSTTSPDYHFTSSYSDDTRSPQDSRVTINHPLGGDKVTGSRTDWIKRRNGESQEDSNVLTGDRTSIPEALSPVDSVIHFFSSKSSSVTSTHTIFTFILPLIIQFIIQFNVQVLPLNHH